MSELLTKEIDELKRSLFKMASLVDEQVERAIQVVQSGDINLVSEIKEKDLEIDSFDNKIKVKCENIFALFQPVASDLRFIMAVLMINNQLERCGDIAVNIANRIKKTIKNHNLVIESKIIDMANDAKQMVNDAIDSFLNEDTSLAEKVITDDERIDFNHKKIFKYIVNKIRNESTLVEAGAHLIVLIKHIERLADHATNIAEQTIFYKTADIISHKKKLLRFGDRV